MHKAKAIRTKSRGYSFRFNSDNNLDRSMQYMKCLIEWNSKWQKACLMILSNCSQIWTTTRLTQNRGFTPNELSINRGGQDVINSISFGPNITAALKSGEVNIEGYRKGILMSELPKKVKMNMLRQLAQIEDRNITQKKGRQEWSLSLRQRKEI